MFIGDGDVSPNWMFMNPVIAELDVSELVISELRTLKINIPTNEHFRIRSKYKKYAIGCFRTHLKCD